MNKNEITQPNLVTETVEDQLSYFASNDTHTPSYAELQDLAAKESANTAAQNAEENEEEEESSDVYTDPLGKLRVDGTVFTGSIQRRTKSSSRKQKHKLGLKTSNVVQSIGYKITNLETGEWIFMEKLEAIALVRQLKVTNASVRSRQNSDRDDQGQLIQSNIHLNLHPVRGEKPFTDADRLYPVYKLNPRSGKVVKPLELHLAEENCTPRLWQIILEHKKQNTPKNPNQYNRISKEEKLRRIDNAIAAANFGDVENPFSSND